MTSVELLHFSQELLRWKVEVEYFIFMGFLVTGGAAVLMSIHAELKMTEMAMLDLVDDDYVDRTL